MKKEKVTKESLLKENAVLKAKIERIEADDVARRTVLSELLDSYDLEGNPWWSPKKKVLVRDWLGVSFLIGELKADADFSCTIEARDNFRNEAEQLRAELRAMQNPKKDETMSQ